MFTTSDYEKLKNCLSDDEEGLFLLQKLLSSHEETLRMLGHEIRNPLTMLQASIQFIERMHPEVATYAYWKSLQQDLDHITDLLDDLSSYAQGTSLSLSTFPAAPFLRGTVLSFAACFEECDIPFTSEIPDTLPTITADRTKLHETLLNLLKNAKEAFSEASTTKRENQLPQIRFAASVCSLKETSMLSSENSTKKSSSAERLRITISDNGCGIPADQIHRIFSPFVTYKPNGTGLGLTICKRIVEAHHGKLLVTSESGKGTTFTILLPVNAF